VVQLKSWRHFVPMKRAVPCPSAGRERECGQGADQPRRSLVPRAVPTARMNWAPDNYPMQQTEMARRSARMGQVSRGRASAAASSVPTRCSITFALAARPERASVSCAPPPCPFNRVTLAGDGQKIK
jgi:hypothetical protein